MQPTLGSIGQAAFLGHRNEIAQMPKLHAFRYTLEV
jgi:hypothetical protein